MSQKLYHQIGMNLRSYRRLAKLTQEDLAEKADISVHHLGFIERGKAKPTLATLERIASALGLHTEDLFRFSKVGKPDPQELLQELLHFLKHRSPYELRLLVSINRQITELLPATKRP